MADPLMHYGVSRRVRRPDARTLTLYDPVCHHRGLKDQTTTIKTLVTCKRCLQSLGRPRTHERTDHA